MTYYVISGGHPLPLDTVLVPTPEITDPKNQSILVVTRLLGENGVVVRVLAPGFEPLAFKTRNAAEIVLGRARKSTEGSIDETRRPWRIVDHSGLRVAQGKDPVKRGVRRAFATHAERVHDAATETENNATHWRKP